MLNENTAQEDLTESNNLKPWLSIQALADALNKEADAKEWTHWSIRYYIENGHKNGLNQYVSRLGKRILVSKPGFYKWVADNRKLSGKNG